MLSHVISPGKPAALDSLRPALDYHPTNHFSCMLAFSHSGQVRAPLQKVKSDSFSFLTLPLVNYEYYQIFVTCQD